jgi:hypothetical protein
MRLISLRPPLLLGLLLAAWVFLPAPALRAAWQMEEVRVTVVVVLASERNPMIDPALKCLAEEVQKKRPQLIGFQQGPQISKSCVVGKEEPFELIEGQTAQITVRHGANAKNMVCLKVKSPGVGEIVYASVCGKFFPLVTEYRTKQQETLILAIRIEPCKGKK